LRTSRNGVIGSINALRASPKDFTALSGSYFGLSCVSKTLTVDEVNTLVIESIMNAVDLSLSGGRRGE
jgi:hypothetical protein